MIRYRAQWVLPIAGPAIRDGWVAVDGHRVAGAGPMGPGVAAADRDLGSVAVLPGLVNAHTHLELSYLRDQVPPSSAFVTWIRGVMAERRRRPDPEAGEILAAVEAGIAECARCGTALVGDITNTLVTFAPLARSELGGVVFYELIRFNTPDPAGFVEAANRQLDSLVPTRRLRASLAAHAPYSVSPMVLHAIRRTLDRDPTAPCSIHLSESTEESEFIASGTGPWRRFLEEVGSWDSAWVPPGGTPVEYLEDHGFLNNQVLAVHGVQMTPGDLATLAARDATLVTCPRSNGHTGAGAPPLADFYASGVRVAVGTDSLASTPDLNIFAELATMRALAPSIPAAALLETATRHGARALGLEADYGTIEPGKRARLIAVAVPPAVDDVEEYLVSGVRPEQITWIETNDH